jgi:PAS domain S-box-containing protein
MRQVVIAMEPLTSAADRAEADRFFRLAMDLLCVVTLDGRFRRVNPACTRALGYSAEQLLAAPIFSFIHPDDRAATEAEYRKLSAGEPTTDLENRFRCADGSYKWFAWSYHPVAAENLAFGVGRDITERKRAEEERERLLGSERAARSEAEAANRLKDEFLATLSHELRSPLTGIIGHAEFLMRSPKTRHLEHVRRAAETICRNAAAQARLVNDLLDLARLQTGKLSLNAKLIALSDAVADALAAVHEDAAAKHIALRVELAPEPLTVEADALRVQQVVWNLLSNAIKFTPVGGQVTVRLAREGEEARLDVEDTGAGIAPDFLPHVFEMFRQADARTTRRHGGLGIGLALVRELTELQGGRVEAASAGLWRGARFTVRLPLKAQPAATGQAAAVKPAPGELAGLRVLIVDDTPDTAGALRLLLELEGARVASAGGGAEALALAEKEDFDLLLTDISMPGMDGYELLAELRRRPQTANLRAIALTGFGREEDVERTRAAGFVTHMTKPVEFNDLIKIVKSAARPAPQTSASQSET